jgi:hypothetical protein
LHPGLPTLWSDAPVVAWYDSGVVRAGEGKL